MNPEFQWIITALIVPAMVWLAKTGHDSQQSFIAFLKAEADRADAERRDNRVLMDGMRHSMEEISTWFQTHYVVPDSCPLLPENRERLDAMRVKHP